jgi:hypothetical protein
MFRRYYFSILKYIKMGWSKWFSGPGGHKYSEKTERHSDGSKTTHILSTNGGGKSNHTHTVIKSDSSGKIKSAHQDGPKHDRR